MIENVIWKNNFRILISIQPLVKQMPHLKAVLYFCYFSNWKYVSVISGFTDNRWDIYLELCHNKNVLYFKNQLQMQGHSTEFWLFISHIPYFVCGTVSIEKKLKSALKKKSALKIFLCGGKLRFCTLFKNQRFIW